MCWCGTLGHGLAGMGVLGWWLDLMILEVFANLNDSMTLWFCENRNGGNWLWTKRKIIVCKTESKRTKKEMIIWSGMCSCIRATCLNVWASPQTAVVILYLQHTFTSALCMLAYRFIFWPKCPPFLPAGYVLQEKAESGYFLAFLEIRHALADGWWCTSRLTGYAKKLVAFQATGMCLKPADLTKTPAWTAADSRPSHGGCPVDLYLHRKSEAAGVCLISGIWAA